jgi:uncharacterized protein
MQKNTIAFALLAAALFTSPVPALAQTATGKKPLVARVLKSQQPLIEGIARGLVERPALDMLGRADAVLSTSVPADKRDAVAQGIQGDVKRYMDDVGPGVRSRAVALAPQTIGLLLESKFSEDELKQLAAFLESPAYAKFQQLGGDMQKSLLEKLVAETRAGVEPKVMALDQAIGKRLNAAVPASPPPAAAPAAK